MALIPTLSTALILGGAVLLAVAASRTRQILGLVQDSPHARSWHVLRLLMLAFIGAYAGAIAIVLTSSGAALSLLTGSVFLGGALFVLLVVRLGHQTVAQLKASAELNAARSHELQTTLNDLEDTNRALARSNADLEQFAYVTSHDLQEPLRKVRAFAHLLGTDSGSQLTDEGRQYVSRMRSTADRMSALIDDVLTLSRITRAPSAYEQVDLNAVLSEIVEDLADRVRATQGAVHIGELPKVCARPIHMRQLFQNLVANGLKFHRDGVAPNVGVTAQSIDDEAIGPAWEIVVEDNGIGFGPEQSERMFGLFERLHKDAQYDGSGVGLSICQKIATGHGGRICAEGQPDLGARFIVTLPLVPPSLGGTSADERHMATEDTPDSASPTSSRAR